MRTKVKEADAQGIPEVVQVDSSEAGSMPDMVDIVINALDHVGVPVEQEKEVSGSIWITTSEGIVLVKKNYGNGMYEAHIEQLPDHDADNVASHIINNTEGGYSGASQDDVDGQYEFEDITEDIKEEHGTSSKGGEIETPNEYTSGLDVSGTHSGKGDVAAEITVYEDGTYELTNMKGGNNHEATFSAIVAIQDMGREDKPLIPLMITEDGWSPAISTVKEIAEMVEDRFMDMI